MIQQNVPMTPQAFALVVGPEGVRTICNADQLAPEVGLMMVALTRLLTLCRSEPEELRVLFTTAADELHRLGRVCNCDRCQVGRMTNDAARAHFEARLAQRRRPN